jgi:LacI family transcriptional regulator
MQRTGIGEDIPEPTGHNIALRQSFYVSRQAILLECGAMANPRTVAILVNLRIAYCRGVFEGVARHARHAGWKLLFQTAADYEAQSDPTFWKDQNVDGFVLQVVGRSLLKLAHAGTPAVNISTALPRHAAVPTVCTDNEALGRAAAEHLLLQPLSHFGYFAEPNRYFSEPRGKGFIEALAHAGYPCSMLASDKPREIAAWVKALPKPVGLFASSDMLASNLLNVCQAAGVEICGRVALVGVDNVRDICESTFPRLTSVAQQSERIGWEAAAMLERLMTSASRGQPPVRPPDMIMPAAPVVVRESSMLHPMDVEISEALKLIRTDYASLQDVDELAQRLSISRRTVERRFRDLLGRSPLDEIVRVRTAAARQLLAETQLSVAQIATQCGFGSATRMGLVFRERVGCTPTAYRRTMRGRTESKGLRQPNSRKENDM